MNLVLLAFYKDPAIYKNHCGTRQLKTISGLAVLSAFVTGTKRWSDQSASFRNSMFMAHYQDVSGCLVVGGQNCPLKNFRKMSKVLFNRYLKKIDIPRK